MYDLVLSPESFTNPKLSAPAITIALTANVVLQSVTVTPNNLAITLRLCHNI